MTVINLKKYYYPLVKTDVFVEVSDEVAEALLLMRREDNNRTSKIWYHKAYFSLDCEDGIENEAIGWAQPSPEDYMIQAEDEAAHELLLEHLREAIDTLTPHTSPPPAYALYAENEIPGDCRCRGYQPDTGQRFRAGRS